MLVLITDATDGTWLTYVPCDSRQICHEYLLKKPGPVY